MGPDYEKYRPLLDGLNLGQEKEDELVHAVWSMMKSFVDASVGDDPTQLAMEQKKNKSGQSRQNEVSSQISQQKQTTEGIEP